MDQAGFRLHQFTQFAAARPNFGPQIVGPTGVRGKVCAALIGSTPDPGEVISRETVTIMNPDVLPAASPNGRQIDARQHA